MKNSKPIGRLEGQQEVFAYSAFAIHEKVPSRFVWDALVDAETGFVCPGCGEINKALGHGEKTECRCGLTFVLYGNGLHVSRGTIGI